MIAFQTSATMTHPNWAARVSGVPAQMSKSSFSLQKPKKDPGAVDQVPHEGLGRGKAVTCSLQADSGPSRARSCPLQIASFPAACLTLRVEFMKKRDFDRKVLLGGASSVPHFWGCFSGHSRLPPPCASPPAAACFTRHFACCHEVACLPQREQAPVGSTIDKGFQQSHVPGL